ncbi:MAG TPA: amidohydrolase family protein [Pyrinomonadaceae bacterium]|nr:amidohydrolase family protein [Pyrinomonadaceae bacterium]
MTRPVALLLVLMVFAAVNAQRRQAQRPQTRALVLTHVTVIDMTGAPAKADMTVVITGSRITAVGKVGQARPPLGAQIVDANGMFLIPGLWDMHVHFTEIERSFPLFIANGVTGVRNMGGDRLPRESYFAMVEEGKKLELPIVGHVPLSVTSVEASESGQRSIEHLGSILESTSSIESELHRLETSGEPVTDPSEFPRRIAARGARMLDTYDARKAQEVFAILVRNQTWQVPTLEFKWAQTYIDDLSRNGDSRLRYIPESEQQWWAPQKNFFARFRTAEYISYRKRLFKELELVGAMHKAGVSFMTGTDLSGAYVFAGFSLHHELELYVQAGFTPMEALQAATRNPAIFFGELNSHGTVEEGKVADLVLLGANPLENIRNTQRIDGVVLNGRYLPKQTLQRMLDKVEAAARRR